MSTFVIKVKNTSVENAFAWLRARNGKADADGKMIYVGESDQFELVAPVEIPEDDARQSIANFFDGKIVYTRATADAGRKGGPILAFQVTKTDFIFFGRH
jgi:hypothetical protein